MVLGVVMTEQKNKFFTQEGYYVCWKTKKDNFRIFVQGESPAKTLFAKLRKMNTTTELFKIRAGKMKKVA